MDAVCDAAIPSRGSPDLIWATITLHHEQVTLAQLETRQLAVEKFHLVDFIEVQSASLNVCHSEKWILVLHWTALSLFLNAALNIRDVSELHPAPASRQIGHAESSSFSSASSGSARSPKAPAYPSIPPRSLNGAPSRSSGLISTLTAITSLILSSHHV